MKKIFILLLLAGHTFIANSQIVDTIEVYSRQMGRNIKNVVVLPDGYRKDDRKNYPVLYLLNGFSGRYDTYIRHVKPSLPQDAGRWQMIFVCPDGQDSWYWDSPIDPQCQFETYISKELIPRIDSLYNTVAAPEGRAVTGLSMGGHGGLWLGINHPDVFGACGSMSGGVDIRPFPNNWKMKDRLGKYSENKEVWDTHTVINQISKIEPGRLSIIIDCGTDDFFYQVNENLHRTLLYHNIPHDYIVRPGRHDGKYWNNAIDYQFMFFSKFFNSGKGAE